MMVILLVLGAKLLGNGIAGLERLSRPPWRRSTTVVPSLDWLPDYDRRWLRADLVGGLTAGAVVIPQAMAYATIADLPVQVGLYTCMVPMAVYALPRWLAHAVGEHDVDGRHPHRLDPARGRRRRREHAIPRATSPCSPCSSGSSCSSSACAASAH